MNEKMNDALNEISDQHIQEAAKGKRKPKLRWIGAVAAVLAAAILIGVLYPLPVKPAVPNFSVPIGTAPNSYYFSNLVATPDYPQLSQYPNLSQVEDDDTYMAEYESWRKSQQDQYDQPAGYADSLQDFFGRSIAQFLSGEGNQAYSPVNLYLAMAMLAQSAEGTSRQQILDLLGVQSIDALQEQAGHVWNAHYSNDGLSTLLLANSLWLDDAYRFHADTVDTLADNYYASVFHANLGTGEVNQQLRDWLNANTGGLLIQQAEQTELSEETAAALASTIYFSAQWDEKFSKSATVHQPFYNPDGETTASFMKTTFSNALYYWGEDFSAIRLGLSGGNSMWLILPDQGKTPQNLLESGACISLLQNTDSWEDKGNYKIHLSLPKFDISSQADLINGMKALGITDVFDPSTANLTGLIDTGTTAGNPYVDKIDHAVRVTIDEDGCTAAAYTVIGMPSSGMPQEDEITFTLDRPFLFFITSRDALPLFAGLVCKP